MDAAASRRKEAERPAADGKLLCAAAHLQVGHPGGQVPFSGAVHFGPELGPGPGTLQQSVPPGQHTSPQQNWAPLQVITAVHGASWQVPLPQNGFSPRHGALQAPQLWMSFPVLTQAPPQQVKPGSQLGGQAAPPVEEDDVDDVDDVVVEEPVVPALVPP